MPNRWAPNSAEAHTVRQLEDVMASRMSAEMHIRNVVTRLIQRARTVEDKENIEELLDARIALQHQKLQLADLHPDGLIAVQDEKEAPWNAQP